MDVSIRKQTELVFRAPRLDSVSQFQGTAAVNPQGSMDGKSTMKSMLVEG